MLAGPIFWPITRVAPRLLRFYREWIADAPDELMTIVVHRKAPPLDFVPADLHGEPIVGVVCCWSGALDAGERYLRPLRSFGAADPGPLRAEAARRPPGDVRSLLPPRLVVLHARLRRRRAQRRGDRDHLRARLADRLAADRVPDLADGGAVARVGDDETAFTGRRAGHTFNITAATATEQGFDAEREWVRAFYSALEPHSESVYVNFLMDEGEERIREAYGPEKWVG